MSRFIIKWDKCLLFASIVKARIFEQEGDKLSATTFLDDKR